MAATGEGMARGVKVAPPQPVARQIERPRLERALRSALAAGGFVLLCAPAGYGKTLALQRQLDLLPDDSVACWVRADEGDDLVRVLGGLVEGLDPYDLPWRVSPAALPGLIAEGRADQAIDALAAACAASGRGRGLLVIDDLHRIVDPATLASLARLAQALPRGWALAATSRTEPSAMLIRLTLRGCVTVFRQDQLAFDENEVDRYIALLGDAGHPAAEEVLRLTQGWPAGVALWLTAPPPAAGRQPAGRRWLFDYLSEEVLSQMPARQQDFITRCSVLPEWTAERCVALTGDPDTARWLREIAEGELFVSVLEQQPLTLRPHDLLREFLDHRLRTRLPDERTALLKAAAASEPDPFRRLDHLLSAEAWDEAAQAVLVNALSLVRQGASAQLLRQLERFPTALARAPELAYARGLCALLQWRFITAHASFTQAWSEWERRGDWAPALRARALDSFAMVFAARVADGKRVWATRPPSPSSMDDETRMLCAMRDFYDSAQDGPHRDTGKHLAEVVRCWSRVPEAADWVIFWNTLYVYVGRYGVKQPMESLCRLLLSTSEDRPLQRASALALQNWLALFGGEVGEVERCLPELLGELQWVGSPTGLQASLGLLAALLATVRGDARGLREALDTILARLDPHERPHSRQLYLCFQASLSAAVGDDGAARRAANELQERSPTGDWPYLVLARAMVQAQVALIDGRASQAASLLQPCIDRGLDVEWWGLNARARGVLALAWLAAGDDVQAWKALAPAVEQLRDSGEPLGLWLLGRRALQRLAGHAWPVSADPGLVQHLRALSRRLEHLSEPAVAPAIGTRTDGDVRDGRAQPRASMPGAQVPGIELSGRETEVLALIAQGFSNKLIARRLALSPHTVKRHVARILDKTDQSSRGGAAAWYMEHVAVGDAGTPNPGRTIPRPAS